MEDYFETLIIPNALSDIFIDFIIEQTNQAIEEISSSKLSQHNQDFSFYNLSSFPQNSTAIILRLEQNPSPLINTLKDFSDTLSMRTSQHIGFAYYTQTKHNIDWIEAYRKSVTPIQCENFYIHPSWYPPQKNAINITIDPALAFGSGHHASTFMCIELLQNLNLSDKTALDVGCGSGILSIVMAKKGANIDACDVDALAIAESRKNFALNAITAYNIWEGSIECATQHYDVICANILADIIIILHNDFKNAFKKQGILILSGIIESKINQVIDVFKDFEVQEKRLKDEWASLKLVLKEED